MDDLRIGRILRALRRRAGWTQRELGVRVGLSQQAISLIERGHGSTLSGDTLRRAFAALDARWTGTVTWRGGDLDRLVDSEHARLVGEFVRRLRATDWETAVEVTYSEFGERGSIDVIGARPELRAVVVGEVKSDLTVADATVRKLDEKVRLVRRGIARERFGWQPSIVGRLLVLPATERARRRVRAGADLLDAAFPDRRPVVQSWLKMPDGELSGIMHVSDTSPSGGTRGHGGPWRVRAARPSARGAPIRRPERPSRR
jgi:transcriptional regulator with XRE-family HTH domain